MRNILSTAALAALLLATPALAAAVIPDAAVEVKASFICADGRAVDVLFRQPTHVAIVSSGDRSEVLYQSPTADGFRYIAGENEIRGRGETMTYKVFPHAPVTCTARPAQTVAGTMTGTISYRERMALPAGTTAVVELRDISRADAPATLIAATTITPTGNQVPLHWLLTFDPAKIAPQASYAVSARLTGKDGKLLWINDTVEPVLTRGAPADLIDVDVVRAK